MENIHPKKLKVYENHHLRTLTTPVSKHELAVQPSYTEQSHRGNHPAFPLAGPRTHLGLCRLTTDNNSVAADSIPDGSARTNQRAMKCFGQISNTYRLLLTTPDLLMPAKIASQ